MLYRISSRKRDFRWKQCRHFREQLWTFTREDYIRISSLRRCDVTDERISTNSRLRGKLSNVHAGEVIPEESHRTIVTGLHGESNTPHGHITQSDAEAGQRALVVDFCVPHESRRLLELGPSFVPSTGRFKNRK